MNCRRPNTALCREILFHLSFADGLYLLRNLARKERRYLIATTDRATFFNADIRSGDFRILNLTKKPFLFPQPDFAIDDAGVMRWQATRSLAIHPFGSPPRAALARAWCEARAGPREEGLSVTVILALPECIRIVRGHAIADPRSQGRSAFRQACAEERIASLANHQASTASRSGCRKTQVEVPACTPSA